MKKKKLYAFLCGAVIIMSAFIVSSLYSGSPDVSTGVVTDMSEEAVAESFSEEDSDTTENGTTEKKTTDKKTTKKNTTEKKTKKNNFFQKLINKNKTTKKNNTTTKENKSESDSEEQNATVTTTKPTTTKATTTKPTTTKPTTTKLQSSYPYAYAGFNPKTITIDENNWNLTLLNRHYTLPENYKPKLAEAVKGSGVYLDYRVAPHYQKMYDAARKDGVTLTPNSGYRSYQTQKTNFENRINRYMSQGYNKVTATQNTARIILLPGTSEHNAGLAMDIGWVTQDFERSPAFAWLNAHAQDYGFILRYPKSEAKQAITEIIYEPWHWRYVGVEAAKEMKASGQVLEEYLGVK